VLAREDVEANLHSLQTMTEKFRLFEWGTVIFENCIIVRE
jgi:hypothetical protein